MSSKKHLDLAVAVPCLNEAENLELLLPRIHAVIAMYGLPAEVYIVDGGSTDGTVAVAERLGARVIRQRGTGYGAAIKTLFEEAPNPYIITLDADLSHHPAIIKYLYDMRHEAEVVIASRYTSQGHADMPWSRLVLSRTLNTLFRWVLALEPRDLSSGFRLYHRRAVAGLDLRYTTYAVLQEIVVKAYCKGYKVAETPFHYRPRRHGQSHARVLAFGVVYLRALAAMWRLRNSIESADYDLRAFSSRIPLQRWWQRRRYHIILDYVGDRLGVLDVGCGSSQIMNGLPQAAGCDVNPGKLRFMRRAGRRLARASVFALPYADHAFEVVICSQVIEHIPEDDRVFSELARCVAPGGSLVLGTPDYGSWPWPLTEWIYAHVNPCGYADEHITHYTREGLIRRVEAEGLVLEGYRYILKGELILSFRKPG